MNLLLLLLPYTSLAYTFLLFLNGYILQLAWISFPSLPPSLCNDMGCPKLIRSMVFLSFTSLFSEPCILDPCPIYDALHFVNVTWGIPCLTSSGACCAVGNN